MQVVFYRVILNNTPLFFHVRKLIIMRGLSEDFSFYGVLFFYGYNEKKTFYLGGF